MELPVTVLRTHLLLHAGLDGARDSDRRLGSGRRQLGLGTSAHGDSSRTERAEPQTLEEGRRTGGKHPRCELGTGNERSGALGVRVAGSCRERVCLGKCPTSTEASVVSSARAKVRRRAGGSGVSDGRVAGEGVFRRGWRGALITAARYLIGPPSYHCPVRPVIPATSFRHFVGGDTPPSSSDQCPWTSLTHHHPKTTTKNGLSHGGGEGHRPVSRARH